MTALQPAAENPMARPIARIVLEHAFQISMSWRWAFDGDHMCALIWPAIDLANIKYVFSQPDLLERYLEGGFPDHQRQPISMRALGATHGVDNETLRRVIKRLVARGLCEQLPGGVIVRSASYQNEHVAAASQRTLDILSEMVGELDRWINPVQADRLAPLVRRPWERAPTISRQPFVLFLADFLFLFMIENISLLDNNVARADTFLCIFTANNRPLLEDDDLSARYGRTDQPPPEILRRPISVRAVARRIDRSLETTRRHANRLLVDGLVARRGDGLVVDDSILSRPELLGMMHGIEASLRQMTCRIERLAAFRGRDAGAP
ncbi:hypothetical protein [Phenylobacterium sp.]|uniref:hypothetical protein n=1 Tax=Phenylobacterium sp. TaxID=1871053 RepID=UPI0030F46E00